IEEPARPHEEVGAGARDALREAYRAGAACEEHRDGFRRRGVVPALHVGDGGRFRRRNGADLLPDRGRGRAQDRRRQQLDAFHAADYPRYLTTYPLASRQAANPRSYIERAWLRAACCWE